MFGGQLVSQLEQHVEPRDISALQFQILLSQQLCLIFHLAGFFEQFDKDGDFRSQNLGVDRFDDVIHRAERISAIDIAETGAVGSQENDRYVARFFAAANELGRLQSVNSWQQNDGGFVIEQIPQRILAGRRPD